MCSNLSCDQLKINWYIHKGINLNLTISTNQKLVVNIQNKIRKESNHNAKKKKSSNHNAREKEKGIEQSWKKNNKLAVEYLSIITANINGLNALIERYIYNGWMKKQDTSILLPTWDSFQM